MSFKNIYVYYINLVLNCLRSPVESSSKCIETLPNITNIAKALYPMKGHILEISKMYMNLKSII